MISFKDAPITEEHIEVLPADDFDYIRARMDECGRSPIKKWSPTQIYQGKAPISFEDARTYLQQTYDRSNPVAILTDIESERLVSAMNSIIKEPFDEDYLIWKQEQEEYNQYVLDHLENFD